MRLKPCDPVADHIRAELEDSDASDIGISYRFDAFGPPRAFFPNAEATRFFAEKLSIDVRNAIKLKKLTP